MAVELFYFIFFVSILYLSWYDLKFKEIPVPNWPWLLLFYLLSVYLNGFFWPLVSLAIYFAIGALFYYTKTWEGGDSKVLMYYGMLFLPNSAGLFIVNIAFYGLVYFGLMRLLRLEQIPFVPAISIATVSTLFGIDAARIILSVFLP